MIFISIDGHCLTNAKKQGARFSRAPFSLVLQNSVRRWKAVLRGVPQPASSWVHSTRNLKPNADARIATLFGAGLPTPPKPTTEGLPFFTIWQSYTRCISGAQLLTAIFTHEREGYFRNAPVRRGFPVHFARTTGARIRDAFFLLTCNVFFATTALVGKSIVSGSPVLGFGS